MTFERPAGLMGRVYTQTIEPMIAFYINENLRLGEAAREVTEETLLTPFKFRWMSLLICRYSRPRVAPYASDIPIQIDYNNFWALCRIIYRVPIRLWHHEQPPARHALFRLRGRRQPLPFVRLSRGLKLDPCPVAQYSFLPGHWKRLYGHSWLSGDLKPFILCHVNEPLPSVELPSSRLVSPLDRTECEIRSSSRAHESSSDLPNGPTEGLPERRSNDFASPPTSNLRRRTPLLKT